MSNIETHAEELNQEIAELKIKSVYKDQQINMGNMTV